MYRLKKYIVNFERNLPHFRTISSLNNKIAEIVSSKGTERGRPQRFLIDLSIAKFKKKKFY